MLCGIAAAALLIHGYHLGSDDGALYVPAIKKAADPALYPKFTGFFLYPAKLSVFPELVGWTSRLTGMPVDWAIFLWHLGCLFLLFQASYELLALCFAGRGARLGGLLLLAVTLAVPVAGTALTLDDPYITARSLVLPLSLFAISAFLSKRTMAGCLWLGASAAIHPESVYALALCASIVLIRRFGRLPQPRPVNAVVVTGIFLPLFGSMFSLLHPALGAYQEVLATRPYLNVFHWQWFEWVGAAAPVGMLWAFSKIRQASVSGHFETICRASVPYAVSFSAAAIVLGSTRLFDYFIRFQPMRCFHLIYVLLFLFLGALLGEFVLQRKVWRWCAIFVPLSASMYMLDAAEYGSSPHVEIPGIAYKSGYLQAFLWIRRHTAKDAVVGLDPDYPVQAGVDLHGFRALSERSATADSRKDSGTVSVFPELAKEWKEEVAAGTGWRSLSQQRLETFAGTYGIQWIVVDSSKYISGWECPYRNSEVKVCRKQR